MWGGWGGGDRERLQGVFVCLRKGEEMWGRDGECVHYIVAKLIFERKGKEITATCLTSAPCFGISVLVSREKGEVVGSKVTHNFPHSFRHPR